MSHAVNALAMTGKFAITCAFAMMYLYTSELYPTSIRTMGLGVCNAMARVAGVFAPFAAELVRKIEIRDRRLVWADTHCSEECRVDALLLLCS